MRRFWILLRTELLAWRHDPISVLGGFVPTLFLLTALGLLFAGDLSFNIAVVNRDAGPYGALLRRTVAEVMSPFGSPYYDVADLTEEAAWDAYRSHHLEGVWVIPADFSARLAAGENPTVEMHFSNYNDDRAKNHRIYAAEILWRFYETLDRPAPPLALAEEYPLPEMLEWFPIMAVGVALVSFMLGGMVNMFMLTSKEHTARIMLEFGLAPRPLIWVLLPKTLLALLMGLLTGTAFLGILSVWPGVWPGRLLFLAAVWLAAGLVILFWAPLALLIGMRARYLAGMIALILTGLTAFFVCGGLGLVRANWDAVPWFSRLFPNIYAVDPLRDLILFHTWPADWRPALLKLAGFAALSLAAGWGLAGRRMRRPG